MNLLGVVCPKCGCLPRSVLTRRLVKEQIYVEKDGEISSRGFKMIPLTKKERTEADPIAPITLECSGGHKWTHTIPPTTPDEPQEWVERVSAEIKAYQASGCPLPITILTEPEAAPTSGGRRPGHHWLCAQPDCQRGCWDYFEYIERSYK